MRYSDKEWWITWVLTILVMILLIFTGCSSPEKLNSKVQQPTIVTKTLVKLVDQNWLVTLGWILCVTGVFTFLNGSTKGLSFIGAGLAGVALAGMIVAYFAILAEYKFWIMLTIGFLILIGLVAFIMTAADINGDGKVNWKDIRDLLRKQ